MTGGFFSEGTTVSFPSFFFCFLVWTDPSTFSLNIRFQFTCLLTFYLELNKFFNPGLFFYEVSRDRVKWFLDRTWSFNIDRFRGCFIVSLRILSTPEVFTLRHLVILYYILYFVGDDENFLSNSLQRDKVITRYGSTRSSRRRDERV